MPPAVQSHPNATTARASRSTSGLIGLLNSQPVLTLGEFPHPPKENIRTDLGRGVHRLCRLASSQGKDTRQMAGQIILVQLQDMEFPMWVQCFDVHIVPS